MSKQIISVGSTPNDGTGSTIRAGGQIINANFSEIYTALGDGTTITFSTAGASDGQSLVFSAANNRFQPGTPTASSTFTVKGDGGDDQDITTGDNLTIQGGTGITTTGTNTDILSVAIDATVATLSGSQTLTNKTITAATVATSLDMNGTELILDADADTSITADTDDTINIKIAGNDRIDLTTGLISIKNDGTASAVRFYCESSNAHYTALQSAAHSAYSGNVTVTLPAATDTLVGKATTDTLTNKTISGASNTLSNIPNTALAGNGVITIVDDSSTASTIALGETLKIAGSGITTAISGDTITLTGASLSYSTNKSHTGDGSTTVFAIGASGRAVDDVLVYVNGICLVPTDDYTISGTNLTFITAPVPSAEIVFRLLPK